LDVSEVPRFEYAAVHPTDSLLLWFAVIILGRYIQSFSDTITVHK
jgi:hypothetical protein